MHPSYLDDWRLCAHAPSLPILMITILSRGLALDACYPFSTSLWTALYACLPFSVLLCLPLTIGVCSLRPDIHLLQFSSIFLKFYFSRNSKKIKKKKTLYLSFIQVIPSILVQDWNTFVVIFNVENLLTFGYLLVVDLARLYKLYLYRVHS